MAIYISIEKIEDAEGYARYRFTDEDRSGVLEIDKNTGAVSLTKAMKGDADKKRFMRATVKITEAWKRGKELPDFTEWAS